MACNTPIIASFDLESDHANIIATSKFGCCVEPENVEALVQAIVKNKKKEKVLIQEKQKNMLKKKHQRKSVHKDILM